MTSKHHIKKKERRQGRTLYSNQFLAIEERENRFQGDWTDLEA